MDGIDYIAHFVTGYFIPSINKLLPEGVAGLEMDLNLAFLENPLCEISHTSAISATYNTVLRLMPRFINSFTPDLVLLMTSRMEWWVNDSQVHNSPLSKGTIMTRSITSSQMKCWVLMPSQEVK